MPLAMLCIREMKKQIEVLNGARVVLAGGAGDDKVRNGFDHSGR